MLNNRIIPAPPPSWVSWESVMTCALEQAALAGASGEIPVGAVIVSAEGQLIGKGHNSSITDSDPTAHAEVVALRQAAQRTSNYRLEGSIMVVTLEPCLMCVGAIVHARLAGVVFGAVDPRAGAVVSCLDGFEQIFLNHRVWHLGGICEAQCQKELQDFFVSRRS